MHTLPFNPMSSNNSHDVGCGWEDENLFPIFYLNFLFSVFINLIFSLFPDPFLVCKKLLQSLLSEGLFKVLPNTRYWIKIWNRNMFKLGVGCDLEHWAMLTVCARQIGIRCNRCSVPEYQKRYSAIFLHLTFMTEAWKFCKKIDTIEN